MKQTMVAAFLVLLVFGIPVEDCMAQFLAELPAAELQRDGLTGSLRSDLFANFAANANGDSLRASEVPGTKSPLRAALYSAVIPGAGDLYAESYWTAAAFFTVEVALWAVVVSYGNEGDDRTAAFEAYADEHWSVEKYALWIEQYGTTLNPNATGTTGLVTNPTAPYPWDRVDWTRLNQAEESIGEVPSTGFSHRIPKRPDQQYYEMIGKYEQYSPGWDDANVTDQDYLTNVSANFLAYRDMRGDANDSYTTARTASYLLVANHLLAALHSAWRAAKFNHELTMRAHLEPVPRAGGRIEYVPTATFQLTL